MIIRSRTERGSKRPGENEHVVLTPVEARPGLRGAPVLWVLVISTILAVAGLGYLVFAT